MKILYVSLVLLGGVFVAGSATASDPSGNYAVNGQLSCAKFLQEWKGDALASAATVSWVAGYMSAFNKLTPSTYSILGNSGMRSAMLWIKNYCEKKPLSNVDEAIFYLLIELYPNRLQQAPQGLPRAPG